MNVADSELVTGLLTSHGYVPAERMESADAIFVNTCAIREHAEEKVHSRLGVFHKIKRERPNVLIGVLGCMAQNLKNDLLENKPYVDVILGPDSYRDLPEILSRGNAQKHIVDTKLSRFEVYDDLFPSRNEGINAWISIMRGCDKFCTFCIVPFTRGRERSRRVESIVREARKAITDGFVEITLLGQNVNSYHAEDQSFPDLLAAVAEIPGLRRLRYTSPHPQDITMELIEVMGAYDTICNSIHFPLQSGSDRILKRMNRSYTRDHFLKMADVLRTRLPGIGISTDIIVGFPGESENDFQDTLSVMESIQFDSAYTFKYSPRPYTKAAEYDDQIPEALKSERLDQLIALQKKHTLERNQAHVGSIEKVLVEKESKRSPDQWAGRTDSNKWVIFNKEETRIRDIIDVKIIGATGVTLHGQVV